MKVAYSLTPHCKFIIFGQGFILEHLSMFLLLKTKKIKNITIGFYQLSWFWLLSNIRYVTDSEPLYHCDHIA